MEQTNEKVYKNRMLILINVVLLTFMATLDSSIVNVALPQMSELLSVSSEAIAWVVTIYLLVVVGTILIFGRLGDFLGKTRIFLYGVLVFTAGSLLCGISHSFMQLIISRGIQALGAAAAMGTNQGIITQVFPVNERGKALGISGTAVALGSMAGPPLGGFIIHSFAWEYIFLINVPIGIIVYILGIKILPRSKKAAGQPFDRRGSVLFFFSIASLFFSLIMGRNYGYGSPLILGGFFFFLVSFLLFLYLESRTEVPLLPLSLFRNSLFSISILCAFLSFVALSSATIILPFYLQDTLKYSPAFTGIILMVSPVILAVVAPLSGYLSDKIGSEILTFAGLSLTGIGLCLMSTLTERTEISVLVVYLAVMSVGNGLFQSPNNSITMSTAPKNMLGICGSVNALIRNLGLISGVTFAVIILYSRMSHLVGYDVSDYIKGRDDVFIYGMRSVYLLAAAVCGIGAFLTAVRLFNQKRKRNTSVNLETN
ncbi:MFS transporter [Lacrimispora aerotolerans]|uniref:MFS transporter n=1 Tax=Lacrimispora aerotolerans TaxID=36832 RepID=UPI0004786D15|nr:MFS transporter [Lacrimispora aerotolerans]